MRKFFRKDEGFTLVELLIVIAIIGVLAAIAIPVFLSQIGKANEAAAANDANAIAKMVAAQIAAGGTDDDSIVTAAGTTPYTITIAADGTYDGGSIGTQALSDGNSAVITFTQDTPNEYCVVVTPADGDAASAGTNCP